MEVDSVILTKRKDKDLAFILRATHFGGIDPMVSKAIIRKDDERIFAPKVSFELAEAYLKCEKNGDYEHQKGYENRVLRLNNPETIYDVSDFLERATNIGMLKETYYSQEQQKEIDTWDTYLDAIRAFSKD